MNIPNFVLCFHLCKIHPILFNLLWYVDKWFGQQWMKLIQNYALDHIREPSRQNYRWHHVFLHFRGNTHFRESDMCLFLTYFLCKHNKNSGSVAYYCPPVHTPLPCELRGLNVLGSERSHNIYWHLLVQGLTFQALFVVLKCQLTFLPQCPVMPFLMCMFWCFEHITAKATLDINE